MEFITLKNIHNAKLIHDITVYPLKINRDESGTLVETLRTDWPEVFKDGREFFMQYCSTIPPGLAKDENAWHYHNLQEDRITIVNGSIILVIADNREDSPSQGIVNAFHMTSDVDPYLIIIPKKTLHGFLVVSKEKAILLNFPTALYNPQDNITIPFDKEKIHLSEDVSFEWNIIREKYAKLAKYE